MAQISKSNLVSKSVIADNILKQFHCSVCSKHLTKAPIRKKNGAYICGRCTLDGTRESLLEVFMEEFLYPCCFKDLGCTTLLQWNSEELDRHDIVCGFRTVSCSVKDCPWLGLKSKLTEHYTTYHFEKLCNDDTCFSLDLTKEEHISFVYESFEQEYFIGKVQTDGNIIQFSVMFVENVTNFDEHVFDVTFYKDDHELRYVNRKVLPYCQDDIYDSETLKISTCNTYFQNKKINVRFALKLSAIKPDVRIKCELTLEVIKCPICFEPMKGKISTFACGHSVCSKCWNKSQMCPICRSIISRRHNWLVKYQNDKLEEVLGKIEIREVKSIKSFSLKNFMSFFKRNKLLC